MRLVDTMTFDEPAELRLEHVDFETAFQPPVSYTLSTEQRGVSSSTSDATVHPFAWVVVVLLILLVAFGGTVLRR